MIIITTQFVMNDTTNLMLCKFSSQSKLQYNNNIWKQWEVYINININLLTVIDY